MDTSALSKLVRLIRYYILVSTTEAGSGHATSALSAVELGTTLFFKYFRFDLDDPKNPANDRFILSKGHASPLLYALYAAAGKISEEEIKTLRKFGSNLEGHPTMRFPYTEAPTGSLGQGLSIGVGEALALKRLGVAEVARENSDLSSEAARKASSVPALSRVEDRQNFAGSPQRPPYVFVLLGDGEMAEGQVWEAAEIATYYKLNNLIALIDVNRLGQSQQTMYGHDIEVYAKRLRAFGWRTYLVEDGNNLEKVDAAFDKALKESAGSESPAAIITRTVKGKGVSSLEDRNGWHGKPLPKAELSQAISELGEIDKNIKGIIQKPFLGAVRHAFSSSATRLAGPAARVSRDSLQFDREMKSASPSSENSLRSEYPSQDTLARVTRNFALAETGATSMPISAPSYGPAEPIATRKAYGNAITRLAATFKDILALDTDVKNSTYAEIFAKAYPDRYFEMFIAEQNMVSAAVGLAARGFVPFVSTFACFFMRAADQLRMAGLSGFHIVCSGSHAGVSIGEDGPSQMGLTDISLFRGLDDSTVLYPGDAVATEKLVEKAYFAEGIVYIRTTRPATPVIYKTSDEFEIGGSKEFLVQSSSFTATIVAAGITLHEALKAQKKLAEEKINVRVIDCYSVKPIDVATLKKAANDSKAIIVVEDHYPEGGLGEAVQSALSDLPAGRQVIHLAVRKIPRSGSESELLAYEEIDDEAIIKTVKSLNV